MFFRRKVLAAISLFALFTRLLNERNNLPAVVELDGKKATTNAEKSEVFAEYFQSVYVDHPSDPSVLDFINTRDDNDCYDITSPPELVHFVLRGMDVTKSSGHDGVSSLFLRKCADNLAGPLSILRVFQDRLDVFIVMKLYENGSLRNQMKRCDTLPLHVAQNVVVDIILCFQYVHKMNYLHGDIKPENILIDNNFRAHVADFGLTVRDKAVTGLWGTPKYQAPEQIQNVYKLDERIDYFNVGIIFVQMIAGYHPFDRKENDDVHSNIVSLKFEMPKTSDKAISFINTTICDASRRLNASSAMNHPFIEPMVSGAVNGFCWPSKIHIATHSENYYTRRSVIESITGIECTSSSQSRKTELTSDSDNAYRRKKKRKIGQTDSAALARSIIREKLMKVRGAGGAQLIKRGPDYYVACACGKEYKAIPNKTITNWTIQPFKRHFIKHN